MHTHVPEHARAHTHIKSGGGVRKSIQDYGYSYSTYELSLYLSLYPRYNLAFSSGSVLLWQNAGARLLSD